jgi:hypothetical protein
MAKRTGKPHPLDAPPPPPPPPKRELPPPLTEEQRKAKYLKPANATQKFYPHLQEK